MFPKLPNGAEWKVELTKGDCDVWLQKGWDEFTKHHSINLGHLLVFRYEGNSHFFVLIFEPSATERDYPFDDKPQVPEMENMLGIKTIFLELVRCKMEKNTQKKNSHDTKIYVVHH